jgi:hypothetical protein
LIKKPGRAHARCAGCFDTLPQHPVRRDDCNVTAVTDIDLRHDCVDDRVIPRPLCVDGAQTPVLPGRVALPRRALEDQDNFIIRQLSGRQLFLQPTGCPRAITPPTVGATAYDVRAIDDQNMHLDSLGESQNWYARIGERRMSP